MSILLKMFTLMTATTLAACAPPERSYDSLYKENFFRCVETVELPGTEKVVFCEDYAERRAERILNEREAMCN